MSKLKEYIEDKEYEIYKSLLTDEDDTKTVINKALIVLLSEIREICEKRGRY